MEGRWTIYGMGDHDAEFGVTARRTPDVSGPLLDPGQAVPVVPCDDAAIERAALRLVEEFTLVADDGDRAEALGRSFAEAVLRAAGETP